jgi:class 3 adenylate cyclase
MPTNTTQQRINRLNTEAWELRETNAQKSLELAEEARKISEKESFSKGLAESLRTYAYQQTRKNNFAEGNAAAKQALELFQKQKNKQGQSHAILSLGLAAMKTGNFKESASLSKKGLDIARELNNKNEQANWQKSLGLAYMYLGDEKESLNALLQAVSLAQEVENKANEAEALGFIGMVYEQRLSDYPNAQKYYARACAVNQSANFKRGEAVALNNLGLVFERQKDFKTALEQYQLSLALTREIGYPLLEATILNNIANIEVEQNRLAEAIESHRQALKLRREASNKLGEVNSLNNLSEVEYRLGHYDEAKDYAMQGLNLARSIEDIIEEVESLLKLAKLYTDKKYNGYKLTSAIEVLTQALEAAKKDDVPDSLYRVHEELARVYELNGDSAKALEHHKAFHDIQGKVFNNEKDRNLKSMQIAHQVEQIQREQELTEQLLMNVLPPSIAKRLRTEEKTIADKFSEATILFADIVGFTKLSAKIGAEKLVGMLNQIFTAFDGLAGKHNLEKIKTIGDCYMVVGGLPIQNKTHCEDVAAMALGMLGELEKFNKKNKTALKIRIGINTGQVVAGVIGKKKFIYDLWGDAVNTASRMESHGEPSKIHVTEAVYEKINKSYKFKSRGKIEVKGKGVMETFFLLGKNGK